MDQPSTSTAQLIQDAQSTTIVLPRTGFKGAGSGLLIFALIWTGFIAVFTAIFLFGMVFTKDVGNALPQPPGEPAPGFDIELIIVPCGLLPFWAIGIGLFLASIQSARRHSVFIFTKADGLTFSQVGPFKKTEKQWPTATITRIHMDASGTVVNGKPIMQLAIHATSPDAEGKPAEKVTGLLSGRNEEELKWLASTLRDALAAPS